MWDAITHPCPNITSTVILSTVEVRTWMSDYIPLICMDAITYPSTNFADGSANLSKAKDIVSTHHGDVIMGAIASQITSLTIVYSTVYSDADQRKHQSFASLVFVRGIHRGPVNSPHKWPVTRKMFPFDDVIMCCSRPLRTWLWPQW